ncbi:hypothetical protein BLNAU_10597 [Blattamonas nauphoetae]|uniref:Uncharacterized protein n=1 Tax=Blattamonas nauphoetae TaxID=2049346 RepID=A0ABQ9XSN8_9EUKA|nr:hypothetical protein BLNAU_10597 [Blattamonas nauphoetae]
MACIIIDPYKSSFQTIVLHDPSFPDLVINSLKLAHKDIRQNTVITLTSISSEFPWMRERLRAAKLVGRITLLHLAQFISFMMTPYNENQEAQFRRYRLIRDSVFEPAKHFIIFMFHKSDKLILNEYDRIELEYRLLQERSFNPNLDLMLHRLVTFHRSNFHHYCQSLSLDSTITVQIYDFYTLGAQYHSLTLQQGSSHCILLIFVVNPLSLLFY